MLAQDVARQLDTPERGRLPHAFQAFALAGSTGTSNAATAHAIGGGGDDFVRVAFNRPPELLREAGQRLGRSGFAAAR